jgi:DNA-binding transcriptional ArsR family regulator
VTLFQIEGPDELLAVRFACSPIWETLAAVRTFIDERARAYHEPWQRLIAARTAQLDLSTLLAVEPLRGYVPDFLSPPPRVPWPRLQDQLAELRATPPEQVVRDLDACLADRPDDQHRRHLTALRADPAGARDMLAGAIEEAWQALVAPFWIRIRALLARDIEERSRTLAQRGLRAALHGLDSRIRWTRRGVEVCNRHRESVRIGERGLVLMPSAFIWPHVAAVVDEPWQPTIVYPVLGVAELWQPAAQPPEPLARLLGRTRARVLTVLEHPTSTSALAAELELSPAGASRHLLALRDAGLVVGGRHGHEVRYARTTLGAALLRSAGARRESGC